MRAVNRAKPGRVKATAKQPNWDRLSDLSDEVDRLTAAGRWTYEEFVRIHALATEAACGFGDAMHFLVEMSPREWFDRLKAGERVVRKPRLATA